MCGILFISPSSLSSSYLNGIRKRRRLGFFSSDISSSGYFRHVGGGHAAAAAARKEQSNCHSVGFALWFFLYLKSFFFFFFTVFFLSCCWCKRGKRAVAPLIISFMGHYKEIPFDCCWVNVRARAFASFFLLLFFWNRKRRRTTQGFFHFFSFFFFLHWLIWVSHLLSTYYPVRTRPEFFFLTCFRLFLNEKSSVREWWFHADKMMSFDEARYVLLL